MCERRAAGGMWITGSGRERGEGGKRNRKRSRARQGRGTATGAVKVWCCIKPHHAGCKCIHTCCLSIASKSGKQENRTDIKHRKSTTLKQANLMRVGVDLKIFLWSLHSTPHPQTPFLSKCTLASMLLLCPNSPQ